MERRAQPRVKVAEPIVCFFKKLQDRNIRIIDISLGGLSFLFEGDITELKNLTFLDIGASQEITKDLNSTLEIEDLPIKRVIVSHTSNRFAVEFDELDNHQRALLIHFIKSNQK